MKTVLIAASLGVSATMGASASTVTYAFKGFVEHRPDAGPTEPADYGHIIPVRITVNTDAPGTLSGNTETYNGSGSADPLVSTRFGTKIIPQSSYDSLAITRNSDGSSSIVIQSYAVQVGSYTISFVSSARSVVPSFDIPSKIQTLQFDTSSFSSNYPGAFVGGDLTTAGVPQVSSAARR